jgi:hypothetical protein
VNILLIDADSTIPNLALMKLSSFYKQNGDNICFKKLNIPYYPNRKKTIHNINTSKFDKTFCSVIFKNNNLFVCGENITFGGSGFSLSINLPSEIEATEPDYSLYPENNTSYGFISRGCIRKCSFCIVPEKEGYIKQVNTIDNILHHKKIKFLDNNFLALPNCKELLRELVNKKIKCQFNQGLDIRLVDSEISYLLSKLNYLGEYIFAFDNIKFKKIIEEKLCLLSWRKPFQFKFFVYIHPDMNIYETVDRINFLKDCCCLSYIMRDISCWDSKYSFFYTDLAAYCNQPNFFKKMSFSDFLNKRHKNIDRINKSKYLYYGDII